MPSHNNIGLSQPAASTITKVVASVTLDRGSTTEHQEILTIGGAESSLEVARVMASAPASTDYGVVVRTAGDVMLPTTQVIDTIQTVDLVTAVSSVGGLVKLPSTQQVAVSNLSTIVTISNFDSSVTSTGAVAKGSSHLKTIQATPLETTWVTGNLGNNAVSTAIAIASSKTHYIYGLTVSIINPSSCKVRFLSGATELWQMDLHSTAASAGAVQAITPPNYLFHTESSGNLIVASSGATSSNLSYNVSYYSSS